MKPPASGFDALLQRMPRWFVEHALKTQARSRRRRAAQAVRFELAFAPEPPRPVRPAAAPADDGAWLDTVAMWERR
ncbi:MAG: hypothetical protein K9J82_10755 [Methylotenera sp.]|nr:hypothetical protein [Methylotenera sp.]